VLTKTKVQPVLSGLRRLHAGSRSETTRTAAATRLAVPTFVHRDRTLRVKVIDGCGMTCTFCHNSAMLSTVSHRPLRNLTRSHDARRV